MQVMTTDPNNTAEHKKTFQDFSNDGNSSRCVACRLPTRWCICAFAPGLELNSRVTLLVHQIEWRKGSNTGQLIRGALKHRKVLVQARPQVKLGVDDIFWNDRPAYILFPGRSARPISTIPEMTRRAGIHLIVPDGSWRQTATMMKRMQPLKNVTPIMLNDIAPAQRRMRVNTSPERMSTFEAITLALHQIEGFENYDRWDVDRMMLYYRMFADRMLMMRGKLKASQLDQPMVDLPHQPFNQV